MTDTTHEAPERIWFVKVGENIVPNSKRTSVEDDEYILKSHHDNLVQAAVTAALTEAAGRASKAASDYWSEAAKPISHRKHGGAGMGEFVSLEILALITPDAQAALDRMLAAERER